jgi:hypothetical protein
LGFFSKPRSGQQGYNTGFHPFIGFSPLQGILAKTMLGLLRPCDLLEAFFPYSAYVVRAQVEQLTLFGSYRGYHVPVWSVFRVSHPLDGFVSLTPSSLISCW